MSSDAPQTTVDWLRGLAAKGGKGTVNGVDARALGRIADELSVLRAQVKQLHDKMTCMCGSYMDHSAWEGHTPVSTYDYALDQADEEVERLRRLVYLYVDPMAVRPEDQNSVELVRCLMAGHA